VVRQRFAKPLYAGSNPVLTSELSQPLSQDAAVTTEGDANTMALREALRAATEAGEWATVAELARLLAAAGK
jgi:cobalamin biosynthesis protein CbiG